MLKYVNHGADACNASPEIRLCLLNWSECGRVEFGFFSTRAFSTDDDLMKTSSLLFAYKVHSVFDLAGVQSFMLSCRCRCLQSVDCGVSWQNPCLNEYVWPKFEITVPCHTILTCMSVHGSNLKDQVTQVHEWAYLSIAICYANTSIRLRRHFQSTACHVQLSAEVALKIPNISSLLCIKSSLSCYFASVNTALEEQPANGFHAKPIHGNFDECLWVARTREDVRCFYFLLKISQDTAFQKRSRKYFINWKLFVKTVNSRETISRFHFFWRMVALVILVVVAGIRTNIEILDMSFRILTPQFYYCYSAIRIV